MIKLTQKEFDLLDEVAKHTPTEEKPFKVVSVNNGALASLTGQQLVTTRPKNNNALMLEVALTETGLQVVQNEIEHEIVLSHNTETQEVEKMEEVAQQQETAVTQTVFVIEDDVPMPDVPFTRKSNRETMPLELMNVGQSFLVPFKDGEDREKGRKRVAATVSQTRKRKLGADSTAQFITLIVENGYRVWRKA